VATHLPGDFGFSFHSDFRPMKKLTHRKIRKYCKYKLNDGECFANKKIQETAHIKK
jgi:hypothetical protein